MMIRMSHPGLLLQQIAVTPRNNRLRIYVEDDTKGSGKYFRLRMLKRALPHVVVKVSGEFDTFLWRHAHVVITGSSNDRSSSHQRERGEPEGEAASRGGSWFERSDER